MTVYDFEEQEARRWYDRRGRAMAGGTSWAPDGHGTQDPWAGAGTARNSLADAACAWTDCTNGRSSYVTVERAGAAPERLPVCALHRSRADARPDEARRVLTAWLVDERSQTPRPHVDGALRGLVLAAVSVLGTSRRRIYAALATYDRDDVLSALDSLVSEGRLRQRAMPAEGGGSERASIDAMYFLAIEGDDKDDADDDSDESDEVPTPVLAPAPAPVPPAPAVCARPGCGAELPQGRPRYCSRACSNRTARERYRARLDGDLPPVPLPESSMPTLRERIIAACTEYPDGLDIDDLVVELGGSKESIRTTANTMVRAGELERDGRAYRIPVAAPVAPPSVPASSPPASSPLDGVPAAEEAPLLPVPPSSPAADAPPAPATTGGAPDGTREEVADAVALAPSAVIGDSTAEGQAPAPAELAAEPVPVDKPPRHWPPAQSEPDRPHRFEPDGDIDGDVGDVCDVCGGRYDDDLHCDLDEFALRLALRHAVKVGARLRGKLPTADVTAAIEPLIEDLDRYDVEAELRRRGVTTAELVLFLAEREGRAA